MKFILTIKLGNDAMQTEIDVANALRNVAAKVETNGTPETTCAYDYKIKDENGNSVGTYTFDDED